jgi:hypothetical protein
MLTELRIQNFKAWRDTGPVRVAPLTVIFGENSAGKSSLGHLLLALKQTALLTDRRRALHLGSADSLVDLGTFSDCLHAHDMGSKLSFSFAWRLTDEMQVKNALDQRRSFRGDELRLTSVLRADSRGLPEIESFKYELLRQRQRQLSVTHDVDTNGRVGLSVEPLKLVAKKGRQWPLEAPEKFYRFSEVTLARYQNADFLSQFQLELERLLAGISYLGPLRDHPRRIYSWAGDTVPDVGARGEFAIAALLAAGQSGRKLNRGKGQRIATFDTFVAAWLKDLKVIDSFAVKPVARGRKEYEVLIRTQPGAPEVKLTDVGFGVSQVLPAVVQAFYAPANTTIWMEQPEIHLHPQVQAELADVFISAVQAYENGRPRNTQLIVESHSEHFLLRLQRRIAEGVISADDVAVHFARKLGSETELEPLRLNSFGEIENWPDNFFGDDMAEISARTLAAIRKKRELAGAKND